MICPKCGTPVQDGVNVCPTCGTILEQQPVMQQIPVQQPMVQPVAPAPAPAPKKKKTGLIIGIVVGAVALVSIIAVVLFFVLSGSGSKPNSITIEGKTIAVGDTFGDLAKAGFTTEEDLDGVDGNSSDYRENLCQTYFYNDNYLIAVFDFNYDKSKPLKDYVIDGIAIIPDYEEGADDTVSFLGGIKAYSNIDDIRKILTEQGYTEYSFDELNSSEIEDIYSEFPKIDEKTFYIEQYDDTSGNILVKENNEAVYMICVDEDDNRIPFCSDISIFTPGVLELL